MGKFHYPLPASGAERWLNCSGSYYLGKDLPDLPRTSYSEDGTDAHDVLETLNNTPADKKFKFLESIEDEELRFALTNYYVFDDSLVNAFKSLCDIDTFKEITEELLEWSPMVGGTNDRGFVGKRNGLWEIAVVDFKWGQGKAVKAKDNPQLVLYGLMINKIYCNNEATKIRFYVYQPRIEGPGPVNRFVIEGKEIKEWEKVFLEAEQKALNVAGRNIGEADPIELYLKKGAWCQWCKAKAVCPLQHKNVHEVVPHMDKEVAVIKNEVLAEIYKKKEEIKAFLKAVEIYLNTQAQAGVDLSQHGLKLIETKGKRGWAFSDVEVADKLKKLGLSEDLIWNKKIKGITEIKKHIDKDELDKLVSTPPVRKMLTAIDDERAEVKSVILIEKIEDAA